MIKLINRFLNKFGYNLIKNNERIEFGKRVYRQAYNNAVLTSINDQPLLEKDLPLIFDDAPIKHYKYFSSCYTRGYRDGMTTINNARNLLLTSYKP